MALDFFLNIIVIEFKQAALVQELFKRIEVVAIVHWPDRSISAYRPGIDLAAIPLGIRIIAIFVSAIGVLLRRKQLNNVISANDAVILNRADFSVFTIGKYGMFLSVACLNLNDLIFPDQRLIGVVVEEKNKSLHSSYSLIVNMLVILGYL